MGQHRHSRKLFFATVVARDFFPDMSGFPRLPPQLRRLEAPRPDTYSDVIGSARSDLIQVLAWPLGPVR